MIPNIGHYSRFKLFHWSSSLVKLWPCQECFVVFINSGQKTFINLALSIFKKIPLVFILLFKTNSKVDNSKVQQSDMHQVISTYPTLTSFFLAMRQFNLTKCSYVRLSISIMVLNLRLQSMSALSLEGPAQRHLCLKIFEKHETHYKNTKSKGYR